MPLVVLHQSEAVVVVDKPCGLLVHNSAWAGPRETTLTELVREQLQIPVVPVHRLDRQTSGCVVFARSADHASALQEALSSSSKPSEKHYVALVRGHLQEAVDVDHALDDDDVPGSPRKEARSRITPVLRSAEDRCSLVVVTLFSGRRHQARRHCKHASHPILGDATHGKGPLNRAFKEKWGLARMALHAFRLQLGDVVVVAPLPADLRVPFAGLFPGVDVDAALALFGSAPDDGQQLLGR
ncbi:MAG: pseudouridine synthase [Deltaproteobacteria bacterium]|nr:pseudouridine synthase [Deltaproteobacteria bacterium]